MKQHEKEIRERLGALPSPGPWRECGRDRGGCKCGFIWDEAAEAVVAQVQRVHEGNPLGEGFTKESAVKHARFISHAREDIPWLLDEIERLRSESQEKDSSVELVQDEASYCYRLAKNEQRSHSNFSTNSMILRCTGRILDAITPVLHKLEEDPNKNS